MSFVRIEDIEAEALKLSPKERARARIWAEEAQRRDAEWGVHEGSGGRPARDVLRDARAKLK